LRWHGVVVPVVLLATAHGDDGAKVPPHNRHDHGLEVGSAYVIVNYN